MRRMTLTDGLLAGAVAALVGGLTATMLMPLISLPTLSRLLATAIAFGYLCLLMIKAPRRVAWTTTLLAWVLLQGLNWFLVESFLAFCVIHLALIWLLRSLFYYRSLLSAMADLVLCGLSLGFSAAAYGHTGSLFLGIWCFFLPQALFALIPLSLRRDPNKSGDAGIKDDRFDRAYQTADQALRKISLDFK